MIEFNVSFPGGVAVDATFRGHTVRTDQPEPLGGNTAMSPFDLFMASIATCAGYYALRFCQERDIATEGLGVRMTAEKHTGEKKGIARFDIEVTPPPGFPEKYREAIIRAIDQCTVKRHLVDPPAIDIRVIS